MYSAVNFVVVSIATDGISLSDINVIKCFSRLRCGITFNVHAEFTTWMIGARNLDWNVSTLWCTTSVHLNMQQVNLRSSLLILIWIYVRMNLHRFSTNFRLCCDKWSVLTWICNKLYTVIALLNWVLASVFVATDGVSIHTLIWVFATSYSHCFARFEYKLQSLLQQMHAFGQSCGLGQHLALDGRNSAGKISFAFRKNVWTHLSRWGVWRCGHVMWYRYI